MITDVVLPNKEQLEQLLESGLNGRQPEQFVSAYLNGAFKALQNNPLIYRTYGPYWWALKALLKNAGHQVPGDFEDVTMAHFNYDEPQYLICAAWAYSDHQVNQGYLMANLHTFYDLDDEPFEYSIEDHYMEAWAVNKSTSK